MSDPSPKRGAAPGEGKRPESLSTGSTLPQILNDVNPDLIERAKLIRRLIKPGSKITTGAELLKRLEGGK